MPADAGDAGWERFYGWADQLVSWHQKHDPRAWQQHPELALPVAALLTAALREIAGRERLDSSSSPPPVPLMPVLELLSSHRSREAMELLRRHLPDGADGRVRGFADGSGADHLVARYDAVELASTVMYGHISQLRVSATTAAEARAQLERGELYPTLAWRIADITR
ncbi:hypothetical protein DVA86_32375 [Streptomyces armeniacus]|uniref:Uncharacterized protein n=1 Tax=Streptomyces armeniacus TaxID=83291 RepID=A0A345XY60_9ACTN|nr:hypothetical protein [Streptomyces armeniacus]AXK36576.1 hypothetical protein DVA86_32375 [Streptomyces armeniacus]